MDYLKRIFATKKRKGSASEIKIGSTIKFEIKVDDEATANKIKEMLFYMKYNNKINIPENKTDDCNVPLLEEVVDTKVDQMTKCERYESIELVNSHGQNEMSKDERVLKKVQKRSQKMQKLHKNNKSEKTTRKSKNNSKNKKNGELFLKYLNTPFMKEVREHVVNKIQRKYNLRAISSPEIRYLEYFNRRVPYGTWPIRRNQNINTNIEQIKSSYKIIDEKLSFVKRKQLQKLLIHIEKVGKIKVVRSTEPISYYQEEKFTYILHYMLKSEQFYQDGIIYEGEEILV